MANGRPARGQPTPAGPPPSDRGSPPGSDARDAALAAVGATLVQQIAVQTGALSANTAALVNANRERPGRGGDASRPAPPRPTVGPSVNPLAGLMAGGVGAIVSSIIAPLAPLAALAQTISATTSGFGTFLKMTQLITTSLAGLFLPAMLVLSGIVFAVAQQMQGPLLAAMQKLTPQMIALADVTEGVAVAFKNVGDVAKDLGGELKLTHGTLGSVNEMLNAFGFSLKDVITALQLPSLPGVVGLFRRDEKGGPGTGNKGGGTKEGGFFDTLFDLGFKVPRYEPPAGGTAATPTPPEGFLRPPDSDVGPHLRPPDSPEPPSGDPITRFMAKLREGMHLAMQSMRQQVGGPAQTGQDLSNVWRAATMAGLSVDPIQAKISQTMIDQLAVMEKMLAELEKREAQYK